LKVSILALGGEALPLSPAEFGAKAGGRLEAFQCDHQGMRETLRID
jgi:hypothetical protein